MLEEKQFKETRPMSLEEWKEFQTEMNRLAAIKWNGYYKTLKEVGVNYLGSVGQSSKMAHGLHYNFHTYCVYLASYDLCGIQVCSYKYAENCKDNCLVESGQARLSDYSSKGNFVMRARILKTRLFFANREVFMRLFLHEMKRYQKKCLNEGGIFSVRINATSDLNPELFIDPDKNMNIIEANPDIMFYDYTKVVPRIEKLYGKYKNYFMVYSYDGSPASKEYALQYLAKGGHVAVVFGTTNTNGNSLPKKWCGYDVCCGDDYDYRPIDPAPVCGLAFKITKGSVKDGHFEMPNTSFIVRLDDKDCE